MYNLQDYYDSMEREGKKAKRGEKRFDRERKISGAMLHVTTHVSHRLWVNDNNDDDCHLLLLKVLLIIQILSLGR